MNSPLESYQQAMRTALRLLKHKDRTTFEISESLSAKGFEKTDISLVISSLKNSGYIDDTRVAERAAEIAVNDKPKGRIRLERELKDRGVSEEEVANVLSEFDNESETERAEALLRKRVKPDHSAQKSASFLDRKGFDEEVIRTVIERVYDQFD